MTAKAGALAAALFFLSACGETKTSSNTYEHANGLCRPNVIPQSFMVRFEDGHREVVHAPSEKKFIADYLEPNLEKIRYAEPDYRITFAEPTTGRRNVVEADNWGVRRIGADTLWRQNARGQNVNVAVIDTGLDVAHPQFAGQVLLNAGEIGRDPAGGDRAHNHIDDDGNGFIDDWGGWNFVNDVPLTADNGYHGTHVAGIIAAEHSDTVAAPEDYVQGVAPGAKLLPLAFLDAQGRGNMSDGVRAIEYAAQRGARVINASWGGPDCSQSLREEIDSLAQRGILFVTAAGNRSADVDASPEYPASLNLAAQITVGATGEFDGPADYSNFGLQAVHIFAPGSNITSTFPGGRMGSLSGTSMATPFVSGAAALLFSAVPQATPAQIRRALLGSALRRDDYVNASHGRMDLSRALAELQRLM